MHPASGSSLHTTRFMLAVSSMDVTLPVNHATLKYLCKKKIHRKQKHQQIKE